MFFKNFYAFELAGQQEPGGGLAPVDDLAVPGPGIDAPAHGRVHGIDRDRDVGDAEAGQFGGFFRQGQAVGGQAKKQLGILVLEQPYGAHGFRIGQGIARTGNAAHGDARFFFQHLVHIAHGLFG